MDHKEIRKRRLKNQLITSRDTKVRTPEHVISYMGATQSQLYDMGKWAVGLRLPGISEGDVEEAFNKGKILRTHVLRPTWHFVSPEDIRWMLELTGGHVNRLNRHYYRKHGLDDETLAHQRQLIEEILRSEADLTRDELSKAISPDNPIPGPKMALIMMNAELGGTVCSGARRGKQFTYALMDEKAPCKEYTRDEMLSMLAHRYFESRGPATIHDMANWSGLSIKDSRTAAEQLGRDFVRDGILIYRDGDLSDLTEHSTFLMPDYDEYGIGYKDRSAIIDRDLSIWGATIYSHWLVMDGKIDGTWTLPKNKRSPPETAVMRDDAQDHAAKVEDAVSRYHRFWNSNRSV